MNETFANNRFAVTVGGGWELMDDSGFLLRLGGVAVVGRDIIIYPSACIGFAF